MTMTLILIVAATATAVLIVSLHPLLVRYALARPNARSSHRQSTPQGGGIAVIAGTIIAVAIGILMTPPSPRGLVDVALPIAGAVTLAITGIVDDIRPLAPWPRLLLQGLSVLIVVATLPPDARLLPMFPWWIERGLLFVAIVWFVNVANFMDGIDWMTVAEVVPVTAALTAFGILGALPREATFTSCALCGAMIGFAPFNRPVAKLFLGDVGSLPLGLLVAWLLALLADNNLVAALLLPLYYVGDATVTLLRRMLRGERLMQPHRDHFYQHALDNGLAIYNILWRVFLVNLILIALAALTLLHWSWVGQFGLLLAGAGLVTVLLWSFERTKPSPIAR